VSFPPIFSFSNCTYRCSQQLPSALSTTKSGTAVVEKLNRGKGLMTHSVYLREFPVVFHVPSLCSHVFILVFDHAVNNKEWYSDCTETGRGGGLFDA